MKFCPPCLRALEGKGTLCLRCRRGLATLLEERDETEAPAFWVPAEGESVLVPGMSRMGKSTFEKGWTGYLMEQRVPVYWWDAMREGSKEGIQRDRTPLGPLRGQVTVSELEANPAEFLQWTEYKGEEPAVAIVPDDAYPSRSVRAADFVKAMSIFIRNKPKGDCVLFLAECGLLEGETDAEEMLGEIATTWGKEGVAAIFDTQSAYAVPTRARAQCKAVVAFKQIDSNDLRAIKDLMTARFSEAVSGLSPHRCLLGDRMDKRRWKNREPDASGSEEAA